MSSSAHATTSWADVEAERLPGTVVMEQLESAFDEALDRAGRTIHRFRIAGRTVQIEFAGPALTPGLTAALEHTRSNEDGEPALVIGIWSAQSTSVVPRLPRRPSAGLGLQRVTAGRGSVRRFYSELSQAIYCFDARRRRALCWFERDELRSWDIGAPLRPVFAWWAESLGGQLAHGALVGSRDGAILLAGKGGSGKSTTALSCLELGLLLAGDDYVLVEPDSPGVAHSLYCSAKVSPHELARRFPDLAESTLFAREGADKYVLALHRSRAHGLALQLPVRAVAAHRVSDLGRASLRPASRIEALAALAPSSLLQLPGPGSPGLERLGALVRGSRTFALEVGRDTNDNVRLVKTALEEALS